MPGKGKPFKKGGSGGPGRPALPEDVQKARALTKALFSQLLNQFINKTESQLEAILGSSDAPAIEKLAASLMLKSIETADPYRFDTLMNRMIGKVREEAELTIKPGVKVIDLSAIGKEVRLGKEEGE